MEHDAPVLAIAVLDIPVPRIAVATQFDQPRADLRKILEGRAVKKTARGFRERLHANGDIGTYRCIEQAKGLERRALVVRGLFSRFSVGLKRIEDHRMQG